MSLLEVMVWVPLSWLRDATLLREWVERLRGAAGKMRRPQ